MFSRIGQTISLCLIIVTTLFTIKKATAVRGESAANSIVFGMLPADAPFMSIDNNGNYAGFDVDLAREISRRLGKNMVIKDMGVAELMIALEQGQIEAMMCGLDITKARRERFSMVHYRGEQVNTFPLVFWEKVPAGVKTMEDLRGRNFTVTLLPASTHETFAQQFNFINVKTLETYANVVMDLKYGKSDAALFDEAIFGFLSRFPQLKVVNVPVGEFATHGNGIAINKHSSALTSDIERVVAELKAEGFIARLEQQWGLAGK